MAISTIQIDQVVAHTVSVTVLNVKRDFFVYGDVVYVYMQLNGLPTGVTSAKIGVLPEELAPATLYMVLNAYHYSEPYYPIGSMWSNHLNRNIYIYKPSDVTQMYVFGSYLRERYNVK